MAANVETMFYTREKPWHGMGTRVEEAPSSADFGVGINQIRELMNERDCDFVLKVGCKKNLIKRAKFEQYLMAHEAI